MTTYVNTGDQTRVWVTISRPDGSTLQLAPGEEVDLDLAPNTAGPDEEPNGFVDAYLKPKATPKPSKKTDPTA